jgi:signal peptidase
MIIPSVIAIIIVAAIFFGIRYMLGVSNPFYVVASGSMVPRVNVGDLVIVKNTTDSKEGSSFSNLKVGDIIVFNTPYKTTEGKHKVIVHRVVEIVTNAEGDRVIRTKGDANIGSIPKLDYPIREKDYIGKVVYDIPKIGLITQVLSPPVNYVIIGLVAVALAYTLRKQAQQH